MLQNTLHIQNLAYNASTNTPPLSESNRDSVALYEVTTAGKLSGVSISGASVGAYSYLLVGDIVQAYNGGYKLLSREVATGTTITVGTGGLFATLEAANAYINLRSYVDLTIDILSPLTETITYSLSNNCSGNLLIKGNGHLIDFTGGARLEISGLNIHLSNFKVQASHATEPALDIQSDVEFDTELEAKNTLAGVGLYLESCSLTPKYDSTSGAFTSPSSSTIITSSAGSFGLGGEAYNLGCNTYSGSPILVGVNSSAFISNVTANIFGSSNSMGRFGTVTGTVNYGSSTNSTFQFTGTITGNVLTGVNSRSHFAGAITGNVTTGTCSTSIFNFPGSPILGQVTVGRDSVAYFNVQKIESSVAGNVLNCSTNSIVEIASAPLICKVAGGTVTTGAGSQFIANSTIGDATNSVNITTGVNSTFYCSGVITGNVLTGTGSTVTITQPITGNVTTGITSYFYSSAITGNITTGSTSTASINGAVTENISTGVNSTFSFNNSTSPILGQVTVGRDSKAYINAQKIESSVAGNVLNISTNSIVDIHLTPLICKVAGGTVTTGAGSQFIASGTIGDATNPINVTTGNNSDSYLTGVVTGNVTTGINSRTIVLAAVTGTFTTGFGSFTYLSGVPITGNVGVAAYSNFATQGNITGNLSTNTNSTVTVVSVTGNVTVGSNVRFQASGTVTGSLYFSSLCSVTLNVISVPAGGSVDFETNVRLNLASNSITLGAGVTNIAGKLNVVHHNNWAEVSAAAKTAFNYTAGVLSSAASGSNLSNL